MNEIDLIESKIRNGKRLFNREIVQIMVENQRLSNRNDVDFSEATEFLASKMYLPLLRSKVCNVWPMLGPLTTYRNHDIISVTYISDVEFDINKLEIVAERLGLEILNEVTADLVRHNVSGLDYVYCPYVPLTLLNPLLNPLKKIAVRRGKKILTNSAKTI